MKLQKKQLMNRSDTGENSNRICNPAFHIRVWDDVGVCTKCILLKIRKKTKKKMKDRGGPRCDHERLLKDNLEPPAAGRSQGRIQRFQQEQ